MSTPRLTIINAECLVALAGMPDESVDCVVCSPAYFGLRDYGHVGQLGLEDTPALYVARIVLIFREVRRVLKKTGTLWLNLGDSYAGSWGAQSRPNGNDIGSNLEGGSPLSARQIAAAPKQTSTGSLKNTPGLKNKDLMGIPWRVAFALQDDGWYLRCDVIWHKPNVMPESVTDRPTRCHEYIFFMTKSERYWYDQAAVAELQDEHERTRRLKEQKKGLTTEYKLRRDQEHGQVKPGAKGCARSVVARQNLALKGTRNRRSVWKIATSPYRGAHFATFPEKLPEICIRAGCPQGGVVLDPFAGSGTTGKVALEQGRSAVLIELNPDYVKLINERCAVTPGLAL